MQPSFSHHQGRATRSFLVCPKSTFLLWVFALLAPGYGLAAPLTNLSFTPDDNTTGVTTSYTLSFTAASTTNNTDAIRINNTATSPAGIRTNYSNAVFNSTGSNLTVNIGSRNANQMYMVITGGSVSAGSTVTLRFDNVLNPTETTGTAYTINVEDQGIYTARDTGTAPANNYVGNLGPVVTTEIPNQTNVETQNGTYTAVADLNNNFTDGDGDPMVFSVFTQGDSSIATAQVIGDRLDITPVGFGQTSITIQADDQDDGTITDTFVVSVLGELTNASLTPGSLVTGETTTYTLNFNPGTTISSGDFIIFQSDAGGPNQTASSLVSLSGGSIGGTITNQGATSTVVNITSGSVTSSQPVQLVLGNIVNPGGAVTVPEFQIRVTDGSSTNDLVRLPGLTYTSGSVPTVSGPIPDQNMRAEDGEQTIVSNLNTVFTDGDGDPLDFSVVGSSSPSVATARLVGNALLVNPLAFGTTTITVRATDNVDGSVDDTFDVSVLGLLTPADVVPASLEANTANSVTVTFTPRVALGSSDQIVVSFPNTFDSSSSTVESISPATATLQLFQNQSTPVLRINSGGFASNQSVEIVLGNIVNPPEAGSPGDYQIRTQDGADSPYDLATIAGDTFFGGINAPRLDNPIADQTLAVEDGAITLVSDLNNVFSDGNGDPLSFQVLSVSNPSAATASITNDTLTVTPVGSGVSTITIEATDNIDGSVTDTFAVISLGQLLPASVNPVSPFAELPSDYTVTLTPDVTLGVGAQIVVSFPSGFDATGATLVSSAPGTASLNLAAAADSVILEVGTGSLMSGSLVTLQLRNILNPPVGLSGEYVLETRNSSEVTQGISTLPGSTFVDAPELIFEDGFEALILAPEVLLAIIGQPAVASSLVLTFNELTDQYHVGELALSRLEGKGGRSALEIIDFFEQALIELSPGQDWDGDGLINAADDDLLGLSD